MKKKVALVTGASRGIGREITLELARNGYDVGVNYRSEREEAEKLCKEIEQLGVRAVPLYGDVGNLESLQALYEEMDKEFGVIDLLVNNAGISPEAYFLDSTEEMFDRMTAIDWKGLFFSTQYAAKRMIQQENKGVIINISSNQVDGCWPRATIYAPTKAAVTKFTQNAAMELSLHGVRVVAVAPGYTNVGWEPDDIRMEAAPRLPLKRFASTNEIAKAVVFLASDASGYTTGTTLTIDGGATLPVVAANDFVK